ncbi:STAS-like domain-containing protein [Lichenibacterium dinghuense]|uniref:STAS-like domain-containing protein n=1 Tax=Lichenibacterium dinghuense TaxID=2895977 RepID=UPI001F2942F3|nr:STAS-like domain-containing protein [Lichenibacterium sp. 6Y81]
MPNRTISVAQDFSRYPGPRYRRDGSFSGEQFREEILAPALRNAVAGGGRLHVLIDGVAGYGSSFLDEAFAGLLRNGFSFRDVQNHLSIEAETPRFAAHRVRADRYIDEERRRRG